MPQGPLTRKHGRAAKSAPEAGFRHRLLPQNGQSLSIRFPIFSVPVTPWPIFDPVDGGGASGYDCCRQHEFSVMTDRSGKSEGRNKALRQDRLKRALRENLKRRKSQARERGNVTSAPSNDHETSPHEEVGKRED